MKRLGIAKAICGAALFVLVGVVVALNIDGLTEAFGSGPPHYSRTTNMDKWSDPRPVLVLVDLLALGVVAVYLRWVVRGR